MKQLKLDVELPPMGFLNGSTSCEFVSRYIPSVNDRKKKDVEYERYIIEQKTDRPVPQASSAVYHQKRGRYQFVFEI